MGLGGWLKKIFWRAPRRGVIETYKAVTNERVLQALDIATMVLPYKDVAKFARVLRKVKRADQTIKGPKRGPEKFLQVWNDLRDDPEWMNHKELKDAIEKAVMVTNGTLQVLSPNLHPIMGIDAEDERLDNE